MLILILWKSVCFWRLWQTEIWVGWFNQLYIYFSSVPPIFRYLQIGDTLTINRFSCKPGGPPRFAGKKSAILNNTLGGLNVLLPIQHNSLSEHRKCTYFQYSWWLPQSPGAVLDLAAAVVNTRICNNCVKAHKPWWAWLQLCWSCNGPHSSCIKTQELWWAWRRLHQNTETQEPQLAP